MKLLIVSLLCAFSTAHASEIHGSWQDEITLDTGGSGSRNVFTWTFSKMSASFRQEMFEGSVAQLRDVGFFDFELLIHNNEPVIKITASHRVVVAKTERMAQSFSAANYCGHSDWKAGTPKDVSKDSCNGAIPFSYSWKLYMKAQITNATLKIASSSSQGADCSSVQSACDQFSESAYTRVNPALTSMSTSAYTCSLQEESLYRGAGKVLPGTNVTLDTAENGLILLQDAEGMGPDGRMRFYSVSSFRVRENGCQEMFVRVGVRDEPETWNNIFADWCPLGEFTVYNPADKLVHLYCISK